MDGWIPTMVPRLLTEHTVAEAVRGADIRVPPRFVEVTGSTNSELLRMAAEGADEWTVLVAGHQESGRGRLGRTWVSNPGQSLLASVLLRPDIAPSDVPRLSLAAGVAMAGGCRWACGVEVDCRWPNDLMVKGRKLGGILSEAAFTGGRLDHVVIGTGVNMRQHRDELPAELRESATSVVIAGGLPDARALLAAYLRELRRLLQEPDSILPEYRQLCGTLGRRVRATLASGEAVEGSAVDIGRSGELLVEGGDGLRPVAFGEVVHLN
jgi:BirA family transcriptional regulator, biotin operon repressor / biotin---[acetyl-CoA-carboxylase] ligase